MLTCERCGSSYSPARATLTGDCPRCRLRDRVSSPLALRVDKNVAKTTPPIGVNPRSPRS